MRHLALIPALAVLAGCSTPTYVKVGATAQEQSEQEARCRMEARKLGGEPDIATLNEQALQYQDCMVAAGHKAR